MCNPRECLEQVSGVRGVGCDSEGDIVRMQSLVALKKVLPPVNRENKLAEKLSGWTSSAMRYPEVGERKRARKNLFSWVSEDQEKCGL